MKLWEKIFLCTLMVFEIFFVPSSIYLIHRSFVLNLDNEIDSGRLAENKLCDSIKLSLKLVKDKETSFNNTSEIDKKNIDSIVYAYGDYFSDKDIYLHITDESNKAIFNNFRKGIINKKGTWNIKAKDSSYFIHDICKETYLFINKKVDLDNNVYKISYIKEISKVYETQKYLYDILMKSNIGICFVLAIIMIVLSKIIIKPIDELIKTTKEISSGNFGERVEIKSQDEISNLSRNFNSMAEVIEDKINDLQNAAESKQRFIDDLSHELKTPLTSIIGYADFLRTTDKYDEETHIKCLTYIYKEGKRLQKLSSKLMDLIVLRKQNPVMKKENIKELLCEIENLITPKLKSKNLKLIVKAEAFYINIDKELMIILISNLLDNAIKASSNNSEICINAYNKVDSVIEIVDKGVGIPKNDIDKIFEPFYMVDKSRDRSNNGAGLGLSICAQIAEIHDIKFQVESEINKGTKVTIKFLKKK